MDLTSIIKKPILKELESYQKLFDASFQNPSLPISRVLDYIHKGNGKAMRPILMMLCAKACGEVNDCTLHAAVSLELLHTASLVHDDVVDESDKRRGQRSVNSVFGNRVAVLMGDYLLSTCLLRSAQTKRGDIVQTISILGQCLSEGELLQLSNINNTSLDEDVYFEVIRKKTAVLFAACCEIGVASVNGTEEMKEQLKEFGEILGLCFQIRDDIFDYTDTQEIGKPTGNDMREGKLTLPVLYALRRCSDMQMKAIALKVKKGTATDAEIHQLIDFTTEFGGLDYAEKVMQELYNKAISCLESIENEEIKHALVSYMRYVIERQK